MALPGDVTTCTLSFGPYTDAEGLAALASSGGKLLTVAADTGKPMNVTHVATGQVILPKAVDIVIGEDGTGSVGPIPHTDNLGLSPVGFAYRVEWNIASNRPSPRNKVFALPTAAGATADFDLLDVAAAVPGVLVPMGVSAGVADAAVSALLPGPSLTQAAFDGRYATDAELAAGLGTKVNSSTYTTGLAGKQDVATLAAATAPHVSDGSALDVALRAAFTLTASPALATLHAGLAARTALPCRLVFAGSSSTEGWNATAPANRYVNLLVGKIQATYPSGLGSEAAVLADANANFGALSLAAGVHGYNVGHAGTATSNYLIATERTAVGAVIGPRAVFHMIGANDYASGVAPATYKANLLAVIADLKAKTAGPCVHVLVQSYPRLDILSPAYPWAAYGAAMREIAEADPANVAFIDLTDAYRLAGIPGSDLLGLLDTDRTHQTNAGHALTADALYRELFGRAVAPAPAPSETVLAWDDFNRADGAPASTPTGQAWTVEGTPAIAGAVLTSAGHMFVDVADTDMDVSADAVYLTGAGGVAGVSVNSSTGADRITFFVDSTGSPTAAILAKFEAGVRGDLATVFLNGYVTTAGTRHRLRLVSDGPTLAAYLDGAQILTYTLTAGEQATFKGRTRAGLRPNGGTAVGMDNFVTKAA